jgi:hypothetical protein
MLLIFYPFWAIQTGMGVLSTHEDFIFKPYVERKCFEQEGGDPDTKCLVTSLFNYIYIGKF